MYGDLDIFTDVPGIESYEAAAAAATVFSLQGVPVRVLNLSALILAKEAANDPNPRKQSALAYLRDLLKTRGVC